MDDELPPAEEARIKSRDRKARPPKMILDNAGVRRIQQALQARSEKSSSRRKRKKKD